VWPSSLGAQPQNPKTPKPQNPYNMTNIILKKSNLVIKI
jgi:hypothetical protein